MISRRQFLASTTGAAASLVAFRGKAAARMAALDKNRAVCALVDVSSNCLERESFAGYRVALAELGAETTALTSAVLRDCRLVIVPAAAAPNEAVAENISSALRGGACVLLESAAGFCEREKFDEARRIILRRWGVLVESPINLWTGEQARGRAPYVDFTWPLRAKVRDFSRVVPVCARENETIAQVNGLRVGLKRAVGEGTLVFLGSLMGPALGTQEREAQTWLREVLRFSTS